MEVPISETLGVRSQLLGCLPLSCVNDQNELFRRMNSVKLLVAGLAVLLVGVAGNVLSIDMGADSMKIALVKPGLPFHVVVNPQSKRKVGPT